jgi:hypothetical protein
MFRTLRPLDLAALGIVTFAAATGVPAWLGLTDRISVAALTLGLACPAARCLIAWRRGAEPVRFGTDRASNLVMVAAMLPWLIIPGLHNLPWTSVAAIATTRIELPLPMRVAGVLIAIAGVLWPMVQSATGTARIRSSAYIETAGLFLASGNILLGGLAAAWLLARASTPVLVRTPATA